MYINMLIEDYTQRIVCEDINETIAWAMVKAVYEERTAEDEPAWIYFSSVDTDANRLRQSDSAFAITHTDSIGYLKTKFEHYLKQAREG